MANGRRFRRAVLVHPHDLRDLGARLSELLEDPHGAERLGGAAQERVRDHFLGPRRLGQYVDLLESVAQPARPGTGGEPRDARYGAR